MRLNGIFFEIEKMRTKRKEKKTDMPPEAYHNK